MRTPYEPVVGTVRDWYNEEGWGVLLTPDGLTVFCRSGAPTTDTGFANPLPCVLDDGYGRGRGPPRLTGLFPTRATPADIHLRRMRP